MPGDSIAPVMDAPTLRRRHVEYRHAADVVRDLTEADSMLAVFSRRCGTTSRYSYRQATREGRPSMPSRQFLWALLHWGEGWEQGRRDDAPV